ncbi:hypothetical protein LOK49_LG05G01847 [Camellia lanceoleosa]|uniref:Uncharacterized protein n=1 Tax=Camellia lanceoleosa TaxID=1840588 RepID=A0ACC0HI13_9ERIC|nr:hypothetical protein LOK49_LG05G01847 [Camellia lanceoleosa]
MKELLYLHKPEMLILMETKVTFSSMGNFFNNLGFSASTIVDPVGRSRVYASPNPSARETLWGELEDIANSINKPWLVTGDFNDYTNQSERRSFFHTHNHSRSQ